MKIYFGDHLVNKCNSKHAASYNLIYLTKAASFDYIQILHKTQHLLVQTLPLLFYGFKFAIIATSLMKIKLKP